ncbi:hypothetical protein ACP4OV_020827 [Aristida adscensionis]
MAPPESEKKSRILVVGGTGCLGRHVVAASARLGHPTSVLVRDAAPSDPARAALLRSFQDAGATLVEGDLYDHGSLVAAVEAADVVISTVGSPQIADQTRLVAAIKEAGNVKRFVPSEFGLDVDRTGAVEPARSALLAGKAAVRRVVEAAGVPYTYVWNGYFAGHGLRSVGQVLSDAPPAESALVLGDGDTRAVFVEEGDIATYTVKAAGDPRAANKTLYIRPPANTLSHNELLALWERKTGKAFRRVHVDEDAVLKKIQEAPSMLSAILLSIGHAVHILGEQTNFEIDPSSGVDAGELFPDVMYVTVDEYLDRLI